MDKNPPIANAGFLPHLSEIWPDGIARTNLAQPVVKRDKDEMVFRVKVDF